MVSPTGRRDLHRAAVAAGIWAVLALVQLFLELANVLGVPLAEAVSPDVVSTYANEIPTTRALLSWRCWPPSLHRRDHDVDHGFRGGLAARRRRSGRTAGAGRATAPGSATMPSRPPPGWRTSWRPSSGWAAWSRSACTRPDATCRWTRPVQRFSTIALSAIVLLAASGRQRLHPARQRRRSCSPPATARCSITKTLLIVTLGVLGWVIRGRIIGTLDRASRASSSPASPGSSCSSWRSPSASAWRSRSSPPPRVEVLLPTLRREPAGLPLPATADRCRRGSRLQPRSAVPHGVADRRRALHRRRGPPAPARRPLAVAAHRVVARGIADRHLVHERRHLGVRAGVGRPAHAPAHDADDARADLPRARRARDPGPAGAAPGRATSAARASGSSGCCTAGSPACSPIRSTSSSST